MKNNKIGVVTWYCTPNYGSQLQSYALKYSLKSLGYNAVFLSCVSHPLIFRLMSYLRISLPHYKVFRTTYYRFCAKYLQDSYVNPNHFKCRSNSYYAVICGSDQIWAPNVYSPLAMLSFVPDSIRKISYAASIGLNSIPVELVDDYKKYISRLDSVSVREEEAKTLLEKDLGIKSTVVLDPTLLLGKDEWERLEKTCNDNTPFVFCYFLNNNHNYQAVAKRYIKEDIRVIGITQNPCDEEWMEVLDSKAIGPEEFLGYIHKATMVITDSFHGTIFSLLYHKQFVTFERFSKNDPICQNSRIRQLCRYFRINNHIVNSNDRSVRELDNIDYDVFEKAVADLRVKSLTFLEDALK